MPGWAVLAMTLLMAEARWQIHQRSGDAATCSACCSQIDQWQNGRVAAAFSRKVTRGWATEPLRPTLASEALTPAK